MPHHDGGLLKSVTSPEEKTRILAGLDECAADVYENIGALQESVHLLHDVMRDILQGERSPFCRDMMR